MWLQKSMERTLKPACLAYIDYIDKLVAFGGIFVVIGFKANDIVNNCFPQRPSSFHCLYT